MKNRLKAYLLTFGVVFFFLVGLGQAYAYALHQFSPIKWYVDIERIVGEDIQENDTLQMFTIYRQVNKQIRGELRRELNLVKAGNNQYVCTVNVPIFFQSNEENKDTFTIDYAQNENCILQSGKYYWVFNYRFPKLNDRTTTVRSEIFRVWPGE